MARPASAINTDGPLTNPLFRSIMAAQILSAERLRELLHYDPLTGVFTWLTKPSNNVRAGDIAGSNDGGGYIKIQIDGYSFLAHRLAWLHTHSDWPKKHIDHINGQPSDNRLCNLREATNSENMQNQKRAPSSNKSSGLLGVTWNKKSKRWVAQIKLNRKYRYLGLFTSAQEAHLAYLAAKRQYHDRCTI